MDAVCKISSQSLHPLQNYCEMKTPTFATTEHFDDVSDVDAKTLILNHKMCFLGLLIFAGMLKDCLTIGLLEPGLNYQSV